MLFFIWKNSIFCFKKRQTAIAVFGFTINKQATIFIQKAHKKIFLRITRLANHNIYIFKFKKKLRLHLLQVTLRN